MAPTTKPILSISTAPHLPGSNEPIIPGLGEPYVSRAVHEWERQHPRRLHVPEAPKPKHSRYKAFFEAQARHCEEAMEANSPKMPPTLRIEPFRVPSEIQAACLNEHPEFGDREAFRRLCQRDLDTLERMSNHGRPQRFPAFDDRYAFRLVCQQTQEMLAEMPEKQTGRERTDSGVGR